MSRRPIVAAAASVVMLGLGIVILGLVLTSGRPKPMTAPDGVLEVPVRDYDMRSMTVVEPPASVTPPSAERVGHVVPRTSAAPDELEFVCGPMQALEQGAGAVKRCEWVKKKKPAGR